MDLPTKAAWPFRRYVVFRCRGFSPCLYTRERVLRSLESPLPLCIYRIAYFPKKNNRQDIRIPTFGFMLIYKLFLFALYVLTNRFIVCYNDSVVRNPTVLCRRIFYKRTPSLNDLVLESSYLLRSFSVSIISSAVFYQSALYKNAYLFKAIRETNTFLPFLRGKAHFYHMIQKCLQIIVESIQIIENARCIYDIRSAVFSFAVTPSAFL